MGRLLNKLQIDDNVSGNQCIETFNEIEVRRIRRAAIASDVLILCDIRILPFVKRSR
jgi:hypothetical protein